MGRCIFVKNGGLVKRKGGLYSDIASFENIYSAYRLARRGHSEDREALEFERSLEENLIDLCNRLQWDMWAPDPLRTFTIYEPKQREIFVSSFRDRVAHHAIMRVVSPIWNSLFINDSYACRVGKGCHYGVERITKFLRAETSGGVEAYCLKGDIKKFFPSIHLGTMMRIIERKLKCTKTLSVLESVIYNGHNKADIGARNLPIGSLVSQWCANLYLNELDQFVKHQLKAKHYGRYMDDFVIIRSSKADLCRDMDEIRGFIGRELLLELNPKTSIFPTSRGVDFMGYRMWPTHRLVRKATIYRASRRFKSLARGYEDGSVSVATIRGSLASWKGICQHANAELAYCRCIEPVSDILENIEELSREELEGWMEFYPTELCQSI